ncbi:MAG: hypothetical protein ACLPV2_16210 [Steroidobacteraceae bacterium]
MECGTVEFREWGLKEYLCPRCMCKFHQMEMAEWDEEARALGFKDLEDRCEHMMREAEKRDA